MLDRDEEASSISISIQQPGKQSQKHVTAAAHIHRSTYRKHEALNIAYMHIQIYRFIVLHIHGSTHRKFEALNECNYSLLKFIRKF